MRHDSGVSRYVIHTGIPQVDSWSTGPLRFGSSHHQTRLNCRVNQGNLFQQHYRSLLTYLISLVSCCSNKKLIIGAEGKLADFFVLYGSEQMCSNFSHMLKMM